MATTFSWQRWIASCFSQRSLSTAARSRRRLGRDRAAVSLEPLEARTLLTFGAVFELSSLTGADGFQISGEAAFDHSGYSVGGAGDINGDGIDDLIIGAPGASPNGNYSGASYVVFGSRTAFAANLNLSSLTGANGFQISGEAALDFSGFSVSAAGDINGDGIDDLIIGAPYADPNGSRSGASYVVFGKGAAPPPNAAPVVTDLTGSTDEETTFSGNVTATDADAGDTSFTFSIVGATPAGVTFNSDGSFSVAPQLADQALAVTESRLVQFDYKANDGQDDSNTATVRITINGRNDAPVITNGPDTSSLTETNAGLTGSGSLTVSDADTTNLVTAAVDSVIVTGTGSSSVPLALTNAILKGFLTVTPTAILSNTQTTAPVTWNFNSDTEAFDFLATGKTLILTYTISATDNNATPASDTETVTVTITGSNDHPTLANEIPDQVATEANVFTFTFAADTFGDVDASEVLTYSATQIEDSDLPEWLTFDPDTRTFSGTPTNGDVGRLSITVTAMDSHEGSASATFDLAVLGTAITQSGGIVTITDVGGASNDAVGITIDGDNLVVTLEGVTTEIPLAGLTELIINGGDGDDTLTVDLGGGPLPFNITFNGGVGGHDSLIVTGFDESGALNSYTANYTNRHDGNLVFRDGNTILSTVSYTGLEPITLDGTPDEIVFNLPNTNDTDVRLLDIGGADSSMRLTGSTFETTDFSIAAATSITINANLGNDRVTIQNLDTTYTGAVIINGGAGNDSIDTSSVGANVTLLGGVGNDTLVSGGGNDSLSGGAGNDRLMAGAGNDLLSGGSGNDTLNGEDGFDSYAETITGSITITNTKLIGGSFGTDVRISLEGIQFAGDSGNNLIDASQFTLGSVTLLGLGGNDTLLGGAADDSLDGGTGTDIVKQTSSKTQMLLDNKLTGKGTDTLASIERANLTALSDLGNRVDASAFNFPVTLNGGNGPDTLIGSNFRSTISGGSGKDTITGGNSDDSLYGGTDNDSIFGGNGLDSIVGGTGNDTLDGGDGNDMVFGNEGRDKLFGGDGNDTIDGGQDDDTISGGNGNDVITGGIGNDAISGGDGRDLLRGQGGNDTLLGDAGEDTLKGGDGHDVCLGGDGDDNVDGGNDRDTLSGGIGTDLISNLSEIDEAFTVDFNKLLV